MKRVASITVRANGMVLLGRREDTGRWTLPSGHADEGETMLEAAVRELFEETGIRVTIFELKYLGTQQRTNRAGEPMEVTGFEVDFGTVTESLVATSEYDPDGEVEVWQWFETAPEEMQSEGMKLWI